MAMTKVAFLGLAAKGIVGDNAYTSLRTQGLGFSTP